jgi:hypothetical protein
VKYASLGAYFTLALSTKIKDTSPWEKAGILFIKSVTWYLNSPPNKNAQITRGDLGVIFACHTFRQTVFGV